MTGEVSVANRVHIHMKYLLLNIFSIAGRWLSGSDLKKVALFGCPTVERRTVFASKRIRAFFNIQEDKVSLHRVAWWGSWLKS